MASTRQRIRADGTIAYQALFRRNGVQDSRTYDDRKSRDDFIRMVEQLGVEEAIEIDDTHQADTSAPLLADYAREEIELRTGITERTRQDYLRQIERDWTTIGKLPINRLTARHVRSWVRDMERSGISGKTIANKHGLLASVFKAAMNDETLELTRNPTVGTRLPRKDDGSDEMTFLTQAELGTLLDYVPAIYRDFVLVLAATGMRFGEAVALQVSDWNPEAAKYGAITVSKAMKRTPTGFEVGAPKTRKANRTIPVAPQIGLLLNELTENLDGDAILFPNPGTGRHLRHALFHRLVWVKAVNLANGKPITDTEPSQQSMFHGITPAPKGQRLGKWPRIHDLRHTAASWMLETTGDVQAVQYMLGHESITTTVDRYGHLVPRRQEAIAEGMRYALATVLPELESEDKALGIER